MTNRIKIFAGVLAVALPLALAGTSFAKGSFPGSFSTLYGYSIGCTFCHPGGNTSQFNSYGSDFLNDYAGNGKNATNAYSSIESLDSDGDGFTNIDEITAKTLPYDSNSVPEVVTPTCTDADGDGYAAEGGQCGAVDCNDSNPAIYPGAVEECSDGVDNNCNGLVDVADPAAIGCSSGQASPSKIGLFRNGQWRLDADGSGASNIGDIFYQFYGMAGDLAVAGDWDGDGVAEIGTFRNGQWRLDVDNNGVGSASDIFYPAFGMAGDIPVTGDWNGDGTTDIGVFRDGQWRLDADHNGVGSAGDIFYPSFGMAGDIPVTGDWNGDGITDIGVFRNGQWRLDLNNNGAMEAGDTFIPAHGLAGDQPVSGKW